MHLTLDQLLSLRPLPMYRARFAPRNLSNPGFFLIRHGQKQWYQLGWLSSQPLHQFSLGKLLSKAAFRIPTLKKRWSPSPLSISKGLSWSKSTSPSKRMTTMTSLSSLIVCPRSLGRLITWILQRLTSLRPTSLILVSSPCSISQIKRNGGFIRISFVSSLSVTRAPFARLDFSSAQVHPLGSSSLLSSSSLFSSISITISNPPLLVHLILLSILIWCFFCNNSVKKIWVVLISPRPSLLSQGPISVMRAKQNSTITCSRSFLLAAILTYLPLGHLLCLAFLSIRKQWRLYLPNLRWFDPSKWWTSFLRSSRRCQMILPRGSAHSRPTSWCIISPNNLPLLSWTITSSKWILICCALRWVLLQSWALLARMTPQRSKSTVRQSNSLKMCVPLTSLRPIGRLEVHHRRVGKNYKHGLHH